MSGSPTLGNWNAACGSTSTRTSSWEFFVDLIDVSAVFQAWLESHAEAWAAMTGQAWQPDTPRAAADVSMTQHP